MKRYDQYHDKLKFINQSMNMYSKRNQFLSNRRKNINDDYINDDSNEFLLKNDENENVKYFDVVEKDFNSQRDLERKNDVVVDLINFDNEHSIEILILRKTKMKTIKRSRIKKT